jgi:pumilio RNA-binding family
MEHCRVDQTSAIMTEILMHAAELLTDQFGNFVIQHLLANGKPEVRTSILQHVLGNVLSLSLHKFSSNV